MALQVTIRILKLHNIKVLHLEPTDVCQAACPLCHRETDLDFNKDIKQQLTVEQIQQVINREQIQQLDKMFMCGNYGDPAAGVNTLEIYQYFRKLNSSITLGMNTNGAIQHTQWWSQLGQILNRQRDYCVFSIDGLADTNHIYRKNVSWKNLMSNAEAFIQAGGQAHWDMLVYQHNQHQVNECEQLAKNLGFKWFRAKVSRRPLKNGLELPVDWQAPSRHAGNIECRALKEQSMYIDAAGRASPCCWLGARQNNFITNIDQVSATWNTENPYPTCVASCSTDKNKTVFENQWQREVPLC